MGVFRPDWMQKVVNVGWSGLIAVVEVWASSGNVLAGSLSGGQRIICPAPPPPFLGEQTDPAGGTVVFPPTKAMRKTDRAWAEDFMIGDPDLENQSAHPFFISFISQVVAEPSVFSIVAVSGVPPDLIYGGVDLSFVDYVTVRFFNHLRFHKDILFLESDIPVIKRDGPAIIPDSGRQNEALATVRINLGTATTDIRIALSRKKTAKLLS